MQTANEDSFLFALLEKEPVSYLQELKIGEKEIPLSGYGLEGFLSNEKSGSVTAKAKEGWEITEVRYHPENNLDIKGGKKGNATNRIFNNVFSQGEKKSRKIEMDAPVEYGKCYTHFYIYLQNPESGKKSKEAVTVFAYDELIIDWGQMIDGQTQFVFNLDYLEGDDLKNDDWFIVYKSESEENNVAEFSNKDEFIHDAKLYCLIDSFEDESAYEEAGDHIIIKIKKDCGLRCVRVENPGEGTSIKLVRI
ncbi:hypothetical protein DSECCO2_362820 [anaerobic digester metagenome]